MKTPSGEGCEASLLRVVLCAYRMPRYSLLIVLAHEQTLRW